MKSTDSLSCEHKLNQTNENMQDIINAIPGGVAIYRVSDVFETVYFSDGVPAMSGYTVEEYRELIKSDALEMTYREDTAMVATRARAVIGSNQVDEFEFRKQHRDGHIVWVRVQVKQIGEEDGCPLLHCVFHNISDLKEAQLEMNHLINSIPGGIASFRVEGKKFIPSFFSDGIMTLSGFDRVEFEKKCHDDVFSLVYEPDRERVYAAAQTALVSGETLDVFYRMHREDGNLVWIHVNGRRMGPLAEVSSFYAVFTGMSAETRLFQSIANETADGIYVIGRDNYDLLYENESRTHFIKNRKCLGQKCYAALYGKSEPCEFCTLHTHAPDGKAHQMIVDGTERYYNTRFRETDWNGIPAYVKYVWDVTEEVKTRKEKERLEAYFKNVVEQLPGGISVIRLEPDGTMTPEFISEGFAAMTHMTVEEAQKLYKDDILAGVHPEDAEMLSKKLSSYLEKGEGHCELVGRIRRGDGGYVWVKNVLSLSKASDGERRMYAAYTDMSKTVEEKEDLRHQYADLILQHYRTPGPGALVVGHCNITQNKILEIIDYTDSDLLDTFGSVREEFFTGLSNLVVEEDERRKFQSLYLNKPTLAAFERNDTEQIFKCFIKLPKEPKGRYVQFKVNLVETPDTGDVTGILTVTDITEQTISDRILHQLSITSYDFVIDLNLDLGVFKTLAFNKNSKFIPPETGIHSERVAEMAQNMIVPKDRDQYVRMMNPDYMRERLEKEGDYTFSFSIADEDGDIRTKNMGVSAIDLRLGHVCLRRTDITNSVQEQQGMMNMIAYTFELMGVINLSDGHFTMYTRQIVLENLAPYVVENYNAAMGRFAENYISDEDRAEVSEQFRLENILHRLQEEPSGYDFVFPYRWEDDRRYKQTIVIWGDQNHRTVCMVRADVTDMLAAERQAKEELERALDLAEEANRAKSDFLSAMSHDIRTPMNAIMGMTTLAEAHLGERERVEDCLQKISVASKHLLSLINDVLDMSRIERSKVALNSMRIFLPDLLDQVSVMVDPQVESAGLRFSIRAEDIRHEYFYGDSLRINQILINILGNAVKFTPEGGRVELCVQELPPEDGPKHVRYRFTIHDTGIGMTETFLSQIFSPFTRASSAAHIEGTGLGLSITKGLVDLMGGTISVESHVNEGSTFQVELECEEADAGDSPATEDGEAGMGDRTDQLFAGRCFLIAEDNQINAEILCELLSMQGASTVLKMDGAQAVQAFDEAAPGTYDAILMDIQMPVMNGYEATRAIRRLPRTDAADIPIVAMTANAFAEDIQTAMDAGMTAHVAKPVDVKVLERTLRKVLKQRGGSGL